MSVKLISYSVPVGDLKENGLNDIQDLVAYCARVSNPSNQLNIETNEKLLNYLLEHKHFSPFEMVNICIEIITTRDIARQILRHRSFSFQEFSQRYADPVKELDLVFRDARMQDLKNRQNSFETTDNELHDWWNDQQNTIMMLAKATYNRAIQKGVAKEQARAVLPEGLTVSRLYMNGTLRSWIHYIQLRSSNGTQKEHTIIAKKCAEEISKIFPMIANFVVEE